STDFFGTAYGQSGETFEGFRLGDGSVQFDDTLLLIEPDTAKKYDLHVKELQATGGGSNGNAVTISSAGAGAAGTGSTGTATPGVGSNVAAKPKSFHGSIQINPSTAKMRLVQVADEIVSILTGDPNASLSITVEINADFPRGASDQIKRAV